MTSRIYTFHLAICAAVVSVTGVYFSVTGLVSLFAGTHISVAIMASSLEFSKFCVVGFLYRYWGHIHRPLRLYLCFAVSILMIITSLGIYGYLSNSYQLASAELHDQLMAIADLEAEDARVKTQIQEFRSIIDDIPVARMSRKLEVQAEYQPRIDELRAKSATILAEVAHRRHTMAATSSKVGPVVYLADALGLSLDTAVRFLILIFVSVFDPLAVALVFSFNLLIRLREKYRNDEYKIGAHSLTSPVDHRYRKSS
jgi:hypothetical protein